MFHHVRQDKTRRPHVAFCAVGELRSSFRRAPILQSRASLDPVRVFLPVITGGVTDSDVKVYKVELARVDDDVIWFDVSVTDPSFVQVRQR